MLILCLDSSGPFLKTGLFEDLNCLNQSSSDSRGNHSARIILQIENVLRESGRKIDQVDLIAINLGPGSFTGLRIGLAAVMGIAGARGIPVVGSNAFEMIRPALKDKTGRFLALILCRGNEFYCAEFESDSDQVRQMGACRTVTVKDFEQSSQEYFLVGQGAGRFFELASDDLRKRLKTEPEHDDLPRLADLARLSYTKHQSEEKAQAGLPELFYLAPSQAELNYAKRQSENK